MSTPESTPIPGSFKKCGRCQSIKPATEFFKRKTSKDGREGTCKICRTLAQGRTPRALSKRLPKYRPDIDAYEIPLTRNYITLIDAIDLDLAEFRWIAKVDKKTGIVYAYRDVQTNKPLSLHRVILARILGREPERKEYTDHIDGNGLNNRRSNLRVATPGQNQANQKLSKRNSHGYRGIYFDKRRKRWYAYINVNHKRHHLGAFDTREEAIEARKQATIKYHGPFGRLD